MTGDVPVEYKLLVFLCVNKKPHEELTGDIHVHSACVQSMWTEHAMRRGFCTEVLYCYHSAHACSQSLLSMIMQTVALLLLRDNPKCQLLLH